MRLIDRFFTAANGPHRARLDDHPQPPAETPASSKPDDLATGEQTSAPIITPEDWTPVQPRRWAHVALIVELAVLALLASASSAHADTVVRSRRSPR